MCLRDSLHLTGKNNLLCTNQLKIKITSKWNPPASNHFWSSVHLLSANNILYTQSRNMCTHLTSHHRFQQLRKWTSSWEINICSDCLMLLVIKGHSKFWCLIISSNHKLNIVVASAVYLFSFFSPIKMETAGNVWKIAHSWSQMLLL